MCCREDRNKSFNLKHIGNVRNAKCLEFDHAKNSFLMCFDWQFLVLTTLMKNAFGVSFNN